MRAVYVEKRIKMGLDAEGERAGLGGEILAREVNDGGCDDVVIEKTRELPIRSRSDGFSRREFNTTNLHDDLKAFVREILLQRNGVGLVASSPGDVNRYLPSQSLPINNSNGTIIISSLPLVV